jgi:H+/Cl- antiporter ClcA
MLIAAVIGLACGYVVLEFVNAGILLLWETIPQSWESTPAWYVIGILLVGAVLVYLIRTHVGDAGHSPIEGIKIARLSPKDYVGVILAIVASLWGGVVLGPEVALVTTGSMLGGIVATRMRLVGPKDVKKIVGSGALGAILALFIGPITSGSMKLGAAPSAVEFDQLGWAVVVAIISVVVVTLARMGAGMMTRVTRGRPHLVILVATSLVIAVSALIVQSLTGEGIFYIVTSGEEFIGDLPSLTSVSTIIAIIVFKAIAYAVSLGSGFRGGPFFPAMFIGAASGLLISRAMGEAGPSVPTAIAVGVVASLIATAPMKWPIAIGLGIVLGMLIGTWALVPATLVGAIVARAVPRWGDRLASAKVSEPVSAG